ncbi:hypothetical protein [Enterobacter hormaechei]|uniref:hypothetical protein n=1 Tax=Enterobacter hormaechei TaxID=158836 RepID=UPI0039060FC5
MECKVSDLVKRGHDQAVELKSSCGAVDVRDVAQLISDLATQLDVQLARSNALAAENAALSKDAQRYRFIRERDLFGSDNEPGLLSWEELTELDCNDFDNALDARLNHPATGFIELDSNLQAMKTPATDAFLAEVRAQAHKEGAHFVANRMLAAWEAGFIDDTAKNAADIARMILTSTEFMADAPEGDFDRSFADGVLEDIAAQLRKGVQ